MYMRNYLSRLFKNSKGFTLIELLVVIGILGVLAAALIATIDPFEQIKINEKIVKKLSMKEARKLLESGIIDEKDILNLRGISWLTGLRK